MHKRLKPEESQRRALEAARDILVADGPQAVTLKAVAGRIERTHANLLHHFGSALGFQSALADFLAAEICAEIGAAVKRRRSAKSSLREVIDLAFDAFDRQGGAKLVIWMLVSGERRAIDPIIDRIGELVEELGADDYRESMPDNTLMIVLAALGNALIGRDLAASLGVPATRARELACEQLEAVLQPLDRTSTASIPAD